MIESFQKQSYPLQEMVYDITKCSSNDHHRHSCGDHIPSYQEEESSGDGGEEEEEAATPFRNSQVLKEKDNHQAANLTQKCMCMQEYGVATCVGDSGGPLFVKVKMSKPENSTSTFNTEEEGEGEETTVDEIWKSFFDMSFRGGAWDWEDEDKEEYVYVQVGVLSGGQVVYTKGINNDAFGDEIDYTRGSPEVSTGSSSSSSPPGPWYPTEFMDYATGASLMAYSSWLKE